MQAESRATRVTKAIYSGESHFTFQKTFCIAGRCRHGIQMLLEHAETCMYGYTYPLCNEQCCERCMAKWLPRDCDVYWAPLHSERQEISFEIFHLRFSKVSHASGKPAIRTHITSAFSIQTCTGISQRFHQPRGFDQASQGGGTTYTYEQ